MILIGNQMVYSWNSGIISLAFCPNPNNFFRLQAREIIRIWLHIQIAYRARFATITKIRVASTAFICKWTWNRIYYVNIHLCHQYGVSVAESQTFLLAKRPQRRWARRNVCRSQAATEIGTKAFHSQAPASHGKCRLSLIWENYSKHIYITLC